jgi:electron transfer flavoprotein alpha subunit
MAKLSKALVLGESLDALQNLCAGADVIADNVIALYLGEGSSLEGFNAADTVYTTGIREESQTIVSLFGTILKLVTEENPDIVMLDTSRNSRLVAGLLGAGLHRTVLSDSLKLVVDDGVVATRMVYGGAANRDERSASIAVVLVSAGAFDNEPPAKAAVVKEAQAVAYDSGIICTGRRKKTGEKVNLARAKTIVGVGRGFSTRESLDNAFALADAIGAEMGCTRPISEEEKWLPKSRYIGISGVTCKPDVYFCLGISGQIQHMTGALSAKTIISINKDKNALIFKRSDYGLVADLDTVLPKIIEALKQD